MDKLFDMPGLWPRWVLVVCAAWLALGPVAARARDLAKSKTTVPGCGQIEVCINGQ